MKLLCFFFKITQTCLSVSYNRYLLFSNLELIHYIFPNKQPIKEIKQTGQNKQYHTHRQQCPDAQKSSKLGQNSVCRNFSEKKADHSHNRTGCQNRGGTVGNRLFYRFLSVHRAPVFSVPLRQKNCVIHSSTQLNGTDNQVSDVKDTLTGQIRNGKTDACLSTSH